MAANYDTQIDKIISLLETQTEVLMKLTNEVEEINRHLTHFRMTRKE